VPAGAPGRESRASVRERVRASRAFQAISAPKAPCARTILDKHACGLSSCFVEPFEFFVKGPPLSQQTRNPARLREWKAYVRSEAAIRWPAEAPVEVALKLTVVYYHERAAVLIDHDNLVKPIQDALAGLVYFIGTIGRSQTRKRARPASTGAFA